MKKFFSKEILSMFLAVLMMFSGISTDATVFPSLTMSASAASSQMYEVTSSSGVNVRKGAGTNHKIVGAATKGTVFTVTETKQVGSMTWGKSSSIKCTNGYRSGWVALNYCKAVTSNNSTAQFSDFEALKTTQGIGVHINGVVSASNSGKITYINAKVIDENDKVWFDKTIKPNSGRVSLCYSTLDYALEFGKLLAGSYKIIYTVKTSSNTTATMNTSIDVMPKDNFDSITDTSTGDKIVEHAKGYVGTAMEYDFPWCAAFVNRVYYECGIDIGQNLSAGWIIDEALSRNTNAVCYTYSDTLPEYTNQKNYPSLITSLISKDNQSRVTTCSIYDNPPKPGSFVIFKWYDEQSCVNDRASHVAIVESVDLKEDKITTIDGNSAGGNKVSRRTRSISYVEAVVVIP